MRLPNALAALDVRVRDAAEGQALLRALALEEQTKATVAFWAIPRNAERAGWPGSSRPLVTFLIGGYAPDMCGNFMGGSRSPSPVCFYGVAVCLDVGGAFV